MAWQTPKTNWQAADAPLPDDFNRIEGNVQELQNTKETPAGAQAKAEAAETNAKNHANGLVGTLGNLLTVAKNNAVAAINELVNTKATYNAGTATISSAGWSGPRSAGNYSNTVSISGIVSSDILSITCVKDPNDPEQNATIESAWNLIDLFNSGTNSVTFYANEIPEVNIPILWKVVK